MNPTPIQWCHASVNPIMGCDGCELWLNEKQYLELAERLLIGAVGGIANADQVVLKVFHATRTRHQLARLLAEDIPDPIKRAHFIAELDRAASCYAGKLTTARAGVSRGYPVHFEAPTLFPGRVATMARTPGVTAKHADKLWLKGMPLMIFISDMGDALSRNISFDVLDTEIITPVSGKDGQRHVWLWLTKRPARMAEFATWLSGRGIAWPKNLVPMTSVTSAKSLSRISALKRIPAAARGLSVEPLFESVDLDLTGIDWVVAGGESGASARPFHVEWAHALRQQAKKDGAAFFLKQLGSNPCWKGKSLTLRDSHGGDWNEWPASWRTRKVPSAFKHLTTP